MSREKKKGTSGNAKAFITRAKALKKLQLSLAEFRRLCILKGIYPRDPRKKCEGSDKTYYLRKDIDFLAHERLIGTLRAQNAHRKKVVKARSKRQLDVLKMLSLRTPKARLDHLVVERFPQFADALRELDDPLCIIALFANLPADHRVGIAPERVTNCKRLMNEFLNFVAGSNSLTRVFVSVKGFYYQATIMGEVVTWITPHRFSQVLPEDVDYTVMLTFLELYECILSFVNFRLYTGSNLAYPPKISRTADENGLELSAVKMEVAAPGATLDNNNSLGVVTGPTRNKLSAAALKAAKAAITTKGTAEEESDEEDEVLEGEGGGRGAPEGSADGDDVPDIDREDEERAGEPIFAGKSIVLGRETPFVELEFVLKASGAATVMREDDLPEGPSRLAGVSYWIMDRPKIVGVQDMSIEYVQPQYVFDSVNASMLLPVALYGPGRRLPPHLSPFVTDEDDGGYRPFFKDVVERIKAGDTSVVAEAAAAVYADDLAKGEATKQGTDATDGDDIDTGEEAADSEDDDDDDVDAEDDDEEEVDAPENPDDGKELATIMMSKKKMRKYKHHMDAEQKKSDIKAALTAKRQMLDEARNEVTAGDDKASKRRRRV